MKYKIKLLTWVCFGFNVAKQNRDKERNVNTATPHTAYNKEAYRALAVYAVDSIEERIINEIIAGDRSFSKSTISDTRAVSKVRYMRGLKLFFSKLNSFSTHEIVSESCENPNEFLDHPWDHISDYLAKELSDTMQAFIAIEVESRSEGA